MNRYNIALKKPVKKHPNESENKDGTFYPLTGKLVIELFGEPTHLKGETAKILARKHDGSYEQLGFVQNLDLHLSAIAGYSTGHASITMYRLNPGAQRRSAINKVIQKIRGVGIEVTEADPQR